MIANEGSHELRFYSRQGDLERSVGREGSGPNEFRALDFLAEVSDSLWVYDRLSQRMSVLDRSGEFVRAIPLGTVSTKGLPPLREAWPLFTYLSYSAECRS